MLAWPRASNADPLDKRDKLALGRWRNGLGSRCLEHGVDEVLSGVLCLGGIVESCSTLDARFPRQRGQLLGGDESCSSERAAERGFQDAGRCTLASSE